MKNLKRFKAFTILELVISLIVIGIVATTFPIILQNIVTTSKSASKEEIFYQEFALLQLINSLYFDENNTVGDNYYKDLNATNGDKELLLSKYKNNSSGNINRIGKHELNNNELREGAELNNSVSVIGPDKGEDDSSKYDDIDDYNNFEEKVLTAYGEIKLKVKVKYVSDEANYSSKNINFILNQEPKNFTNIKLIIVTAKVEDSNITLMYPSMNIGASKFLSLEEIKR